MIPPGSTRGSGTGLLVRLGFRDLAGSEAALRALARTASGEGDLTRVREEAGDDVDLAWYVLERMAELGLAS